MLQRLVQALIMCTVTLKRNIQSRILENPLKRCSQLRSSECRSVPDIRSIVIFCLRIGAFARQRNEFLKQKIFENVYDLKIFVAHVFYPRSKKEWNSLKRKFELVLRNFDSQYCQYPFLQLGTSKRSSCPKFGFPTDARTSTAQTTNNPRSEA